MGKPYTQEELELIMDYERVLQGKQAFPNTMYYAKAAENVRERRALFIFQYCIEEYLYWSPQKAAVSLNADIISIWHLRPLLRHIDFPAELSKEKDFYWIVYKIYGDRAKVSDQARYISIYEKLLNGENDKWPKNFFRREFGREKLCTCLKYAIDNFMAPSSVSKLYAFFGSQECLSWLTAHKLRDPLYVLYDCPVEAFHDLLAADQANEALYQMHRFSFLIQRPRKIA